MRVFCDRSWRPCPADENGSAASEPGAGATGLLEAAGGIGGLLAVHDRGTDPNSTADDLDYVYLYDANGNVGQVIDPNAASATAALKAKYQYDPYGSRIGSDPNEYNQPWRFSTKQFDAETGFYYNDNRYYSASLGRWISRDPIEETGATNMYSYCLQRPVDGVDPLGTEAEFPKWDVRVQEKDESSLITTLTVTVPCCWCQSVKWVQLYNERVRSSQTLNIMSETGVPVLDKGHPWYPFPNPPDYETRNKGKCVRNSQLTDDPGFWPTFLLTELQQDFESCAVCVRRTDAGGTAACVLGCVRWGHHFYRTPWLRRGVHVIYGNNAPIVPPSEEMMLSVGAQKETPALHRQCWEFPCK